MRQLLFATFMSTLVLVACRPDDEEEPAPVCTYNGVGYQADASFPAIDGCNTCWCDATGMVGCSRIWCAVETTCEYDGATYDPGESFPATDGCNTCTCGEDGIVGCTKIGCATCDPDAEYNRHYVGESREICMQIRFACPENTTMFSNDCGCGCEQDSECPEWINCMPGPQVAPCNASEIQVECPYSEIAY